MHACYVRMRLMCLCMVYALYITCIVLHVRYELWALTIVCIARVECHACYGVYVSGMCCMLYDVVLCVNMLYVLCVCCVCGMLLCVLYAMCVMCGMLVSWYVCGCCVLQLWCVYASCGVW